jgi:hypothetical protein
VPIAEGRQRADPHIGATTRIAAEIGRVGDHRQPTGAGTLSEVWSDVQRAAGAAAAIAELLDGMADIKARRSASTVASLAVRSANSASRLLLGCRRPWREPVAGEPVGSAPSRRGAGRGFKELSESAADSNQ